ncbi:two pore domain potassium channel family protein [archaeon]|nr:MAG: two pore domain potassium channel family protein [archaeon]
MFIRLLQMLYQAAVSRKSKARRRTRHDSNAAAPNATAGENEITDRASLYDIQIMSMAPFSAISAMLTERDEVSLELPVESKEPEEFKFLGNSVEETLNMYNSWLQRIFRFFIYYLVGCLVMNYYEGWGLLDCLSFITQTLTTIGYGYLHPTTSSARIFVSFYIFIGVLMIFGIMADITYSIVRFVRKRYHKPAKLNKLQVIVRAVLNCIMWVLITFATLLFGAAMFAATEGWAFDKAFYFAAVTITTVGYGDLHVSQPSTKWFNLVYMLIGVPIIAVSMQKIASLKRHLEETELEQRLTSVELCDELLNAIKTTDKERVSRAEYILHMLQLSGRLDAEHDLLPWSMRFDDFDVDKDGCLTRSDVERLKLEREKKLSEGREDASASDANGVASSQAEENHGDIEGGGGGSSSKTANPIQPTPAPLARRRSMLAQITGEMGDVLLETLHIKGGQEGPTSQLDLIRSLHSHSNIGESEVPDTSNPMHIEMRSIDRRGSAPAISSSPTHGTSTIFRSRPMSSSFTPRFGAPISGDKNGDDLKTETDAQVDSE